MKKKSKKPAAKKAAVKKPREYVLWAVMNGDRIILTRLARESAELAMQLWGDALCMRVVRLVAREAKP